GGLEIDDRRGEARAVALREQQRGGADRKRVGHRLLLERAERRRFPRIDRHATRIAHGEITLPRRDRNAWPRDLDVDRAEMAVVRVVRRRVAEQVIVAQVVLDAIEPLAEIVRALEEQSSRVPRQLAE